MQRPGPYINAEVAGMVHFLESLVQEAEYCSQEEAFLAGFSAFRVE